MNDTIQSTHVSTAGAKSSARKFGRIGSLVLGSLFVLSILLQVFLAGGGIFGSASWWPVHVAFGMGITLLPLAFLLLAWLGRLGPRTLWLSGLAFVLVIIQTFLVSLPASLGVPILSSLHPVNALVIFGLALWLTARAWQSVRENRLAA
jgi:hypothetical protein